MDKSSSTETCSSLPMKRIAILYICTGRYDIFWPEFYRSAQAYLYPDIQKEYFVFTDSVILLRNKRVHAYYQTMTGWPYDTLLRYNWICTIQDKLKEYDYCYFINANALFLKEINCTIIPFPTQETPYIFSIHVRNYEDEIGESFSPERNPLSTAYVPIGTKCRAYSGGFWGGTSDAIIKMCCILRDRIAEDLSNGLIAIWHDQSHLIKYATEVPHYNVSKGIVASEEYADFNIVAMIYRDKRKYGGNNSLRQLNWMERVKQIPKRIYAGILFVLDKIHIGNVLRAFMKRLKEYN